MWTHPNAIAGPRHSAVADAFDAVLDAALHDPSQERLDDISWEQVACCYCGGMLTGLDDTGERDFSVGDGEHTLLAELVVCQRCGWWAIAAGSLELELEHETWYATDPVTCWPRKYDRPTDGVVRARRFSVSGCLADLGEPSGKLDLPVEELQRYLLARPDARYLIDPFKFEKLVASIFRNHGHRVIETARSRDGGIDLYVVERPTGKVTAVQVKRYKGNVGIGIIRELRGALLDAPGVAKGIVVTSSGFTREAKRAVGHSRPVPIELVDANRLLDMLGCHLREAYGPDDLRTAAFAEHWATIDSLLSGELWSEYDLPSDLVEGLAEDADARASGGN